MLVLGLGLRGAEEFQVVPNTFEEAPGGEGGRPHFLFLRSGSNWVCLVPPSDWGVRSEPTNRTVVLTAPSLEASVRIQLLTTPEAAPDLEDLPGWMRRHHLLGRRIGKLEALRLLHGSGVADAFDVEISDNRSLGMGLRLAFVPIPGGTALLELGSSVTNVTNYYRAFGKIVSTFRPAKGPESNPIDEPYPAWDLKP